MRALKVCNANLDQFEQVGSTIELAERNNKRPCDVVGAVAMLDPRLRSEGMLKDAIRVGEGEDVVERWLRKDQSDAPSLGAATCSATCAYSAPTFSQKSVGA